AEMAKWSREAWLLRDQPRSTIVFVVAYADDAGDIVLVFLFLEEGIIVVAEVDFIVVAEVRQFFVFRPYVVVLFVFRLVQRYDLRRIIIVQRLLVDFFFLLDSRINCGLKEG